MLKVYDKAQWHIDAGENAEMVVEKFKAVFTFLEAKELLESEGKEMLALGIDSSVSIHERMMTETGRKFMEVCYDKVINKNAEEIAGALEKEFKLFI